MDRRLTTSLTELIDAGLLSVGERLHASLGGVYHRAPKHFEAELLGGEKVRIISDGGDGSLNGKEFNGASAAITALCGRVDSGWNNWKVERDGEHVLLRSLRDMSHLAEASNAKPSLGPIDTPGPGGDTLGASGTEVEISPTEP
jgi:hypothetical protein